MSFILAGLILICFSAGEAADWVFYGESGSGTYYYDKEA